MSVEQHAKDPLKALGAPLVESALKDMLDAKIASVTAKRAIRSFSRKWKDYSRAALMVMACKAVGGSPEMVAPAAKALVLSGAAFDLHDDIVDNSYVRTEKNRKTTMGIFGREVTLLVGDAFLIEGLSQLHELREIMPADKVRLVIRTIKDGLYELGSAEVDELKLVRNFNVTAKQYLRIVRMKAADVESYTRVGAIIGGATEGEIKALGEFGRLLGMLVILRDDINDTFNDKCELISRVTKESLPLPIVYSLNDQRVLKKLASFIEGNSPQDIQELLNLVDENKGFERTKALMEGYISESKALLSGIKDPKELLALFNS
ncbi:MAG: polyprenyl synthetase family protein [Candidatus Methanosuratincola sp.]|nr:polyprenyl synthetase family protein [Candidatus Methanosuratincola sp.]